MKGRILPVALISTLLGAAAEGHHSIAGVYDDRQRKTIEGVVKELQFVNPHPFVIVDVREGGEGSQPWRLEMDNRIELIQVGFTGETLRPGDRVVVVGMPSRSQARSLYVRRLDRPSDGFWYEQAGFSPKIGQRIGGR
jgi:hypothetical protein